MKTFITITDPQFIPLILLDEVEGILWKDSPETELVKAIQSSDEKHFQDLMTAERLKSDPEQYWTDPHRILTTAKEEQNFPKLTPLWKKREALSRSLNKAFKTDQIRRMGLMIIPQTDDAAERTFHRDWATGNKATEELFITVSHTHAGSEAIPAHDAGDSEDRIDPVAARQFFPKPKTLDNIIQAGIHDVLIFKTGKNGAVHRAPKIENGTRWLSFYFAHADGLKIIRKNFTPEHLRELNTLRLKR